jgi:hypothetical protein
MARLERLCIESGAQLGQPPFTRRHAKSLVEPSSHMALIGKPGIQSSLSRRRASFETVACALDCGLKPRAPPGLYNSMLARPSVSPKASLSRFMSSRTKCLSQKERLSLLRLPQ